MTVKSGFVKQLLLQRTGPNIFLTEKASIIQDFHSSTSSNMLGSFTCTSCAEHVWNTKHFDVPIADVNLSVLRSPGSPSTDAAQFVPSVPFVDGLLDGALVDPAGIICEAGGSVLLLLCPPCKSALSCSKLPQFSLANLNVLGSVPPELSDLTLIEELIVACCHAKMCVVKLQDHHDDVELPTAQ